MRTSEEYRELVAFARRGEHAANVGDAIRDAAADLIDAVAWLLGRTLPVSVDYRVRTASDLLELYRASLRPAKPASGCEGCIHALEPGGPNPNLIACLNCTRSTPRDNWEAKP